MAIDISPTPRSSPSDLKQRWNAIRDIDNERNAIVEELLVGLEAARDEIARLQRRIDHSELANEALSDRYRQVDGERTDLRRRLAVSPFVMVLIDGDNTLFHDSFVADGLEGGRRAAHELQQALETMMNEVLDLDSSTKLIVRIYYNATGLKDTYGAANITSSQIFSRFTSSFNAQYSMFEYIDAGQDNQAADNQITEHIRFHWRLESCKHIVLAASADRGYVGPLRQYTSRPEDRERLTLIESIPFMRDFRDLSSSFRVKRFPNLFRTEKIERQRVTELSAAVTAPAASWAGTVARALPSIDVTPRVVDESRASQGDVSAPVVDRVIRINKDGLRIDPPLVHYDNHEYRALQDQGLCTRYYLTSCPYNPCRFKHGPALNNKQLRALVPLARQGVCGLRGNCREPNCVAGHHCPYDGRCWSEEDCKFDSDTQHRMNRRIVQEISPD